MRRFIFLAVTVISIMAFSITANAADQDEFNPNDPKDGINCTLDHDLV